MLRNWSGQLALAIVASVLALMTGWWPAAAQDASPEATSGTTGLEGAVAWLISQQGEDGAFIGFTGEPDPGTTVDAILALVAASHAGVDPGTAIDDALTYLESGDVALVYVQSGVGQAAKLVLALHAAGRDPLDFAHVQPLTIIENGINPDTGLYGTGVFDHALAMMALTVTGTAIPQTAIDALVATQSENGGWAFDGSVDPTMADGNTTALVVQALVAAGQVNSDLVTSGLAYLQSTWTDGGAAFNDAEGAIADANSTAVVVQALTATGQDVSEQTQALVTFQNPTGAFHFNADETSDNLFATLQAIPAMANSPFPIAPLAPVATPETFRDTAAA